MTEAIFSAEEQAAATGGLQHQQQSGSGRFESVAGSDNRVEQWRTDAISLPMTQYFQQPSRQFVRTGG